MSVRVSFFPPCSRAARGRNLGKSTENSSSAASVAPRPRPQGSARYPAPASWRPDPGDPPRAAGPPALPQRGRGPPTPGRKLNPGRAGALTLGESIGESEDPDEEAQHAVPQPCARPRLGPELAREREERAGEEEPRPPPPAPAPAHSRAHAHTRAHKLTSLPSALFISLSSQSRSSLALALSLSIPPSLSSASPFYYSSPQALPLWVSFILLSLSLPFSSFSHPLLPPSA